MRLFRRSIAAPLTVPETVTIQRAGQTIDQEKLKALFYKYVRDNLAFEKFEIRNFSVRGSDVYPGGEMVLVTSQNDRDVAGRLTLHVTVKINGKNYGRITLSGIVDIFREVVVVSRDLEKGSIITPKDVMMEGMNLALAGSDCLHSIQDAEGKLLKISLRKGYCLKTSILEAPVLVKNGDLVKLVANSGGILIEASGIARGEGRLNDAVPVENIRSNKRIYGIVKGESRVEVLY